MKNEKEYIFITNSLQKRIEELKAQKASCKQEEDMLKIDNEIDDLETKMIFAYQDLHVVKEG